MTRSCAILWLVIIAVAAFGACRTAAPGTGSPWLGDTHGGSSVPAANGQASSTAAHEPLTGERARTLLSDALRSEQHADALRYADAWERSGADVPTDVRAQIQHAIDALPGHELRAVAATLASTKRPFDSVTARLVALRMAFIAEHTGDVQDARDWLRRARADDLQQTGATAPALATRIELLRRQLQVDAQVDGQSIAVLLPLSGRFARLGRELQAAVRFAQNRLAPGKRAKLHFLDTLGTPTGARAAVERAVFQHRAVALLGPVGERESLAAARRAAQLGVTIALLSPGDGGGGSRAGVFRLWSSPLWEAREAARLAVQLGYDRLAVLAPRDEHGQTAAAAFQQAAHQLGVDVVRTGDYDPSSSALEADVKAFLGLDPRTNPRLRRHLRRRGRKRGYQTFSPDIPFDLLYIPDTYQRAALAVSFLPYFNVEVRSRDAMDIVYLKRKHRGRVPQVVQLLGSSGWHHPGLIPRGGNAVEGALVVDIYSGSDVEEFSSEAAARFAESFDDQVGRLPTPFTAQAVDAATLVLTARSQLVGKGHAGRALRQAMTRALSQTRLQDGICGPARLDMRGGIERSASLLRVDGGTFVLHEY